MVQADMRVNALRMVGALGPRLRRIHGRDKDSADVVIGRVRGALNDDMMLFLFFRGSRSFLFGWGSQFR